MLWASAIAEGLLNNRVLGEQVRLACLRPNRREVNDARRARCI